MPEALSPEAQARALALQQLFAQDWPQRPASLRLRPENAQDQALLLELFASTRAEELRHTGWPPEQQQAFVRQQFEAQHAQYRQHYPGAALLVVEWEGAAIGRIYLHFGREEMRLMEITLLPAWRGRGIARLLLRQLIDWCEARALPISLHVEPFNPAQAWYQRLGFRAIEQRGIYQFMRREAGAQATSLS